MNNINSMGNKKTVVPPKLALAALLSGGLTAVITLVYATFSVLALIFRNSCDSGAPDLAPGSGYLWNLVYRLYFQSEDCQYTLTDEDLTSKYAVFSLLVTTLCISLLLFVTAISLITIVTENSGLKYLSAVIYVYVGLSVASLVVDLVFASYFGNDYSHLTSLVNMSSAGFSNNYRNDVLRIGAFILMTLALKGFLAHVINIILLVLLVMYAVEFQTILQSNEHSIHKQGVLNAFEEQRRQEDIWSAEINSFDSRSRGHMNNAFIHDEESNRSQSREPRRDYPKAFHRSDSWHHSNQAPEPRPFSYLEELKRPVALRPVASPVAPSPTDPWQNWPPPRVPAPDYSPPQPRRLKSALKPNYM